MPFRVVRRMGEQKKDGSGEWVCKALVVSGNHKAWVLANGADHKAATARLESLIKAQVETWELSNG